MAEEITLTQSDYSKAIFDNGILIVEKRIGGTIRHRNVPWSVFHGLSLSGDHDSYYRNHIRDKYPSF